MLENNKEISVPEQGVAPIFSAEDIISFFDNELAFYQRHAALLDGNLRFGNNGLNASTRIHREAVSLLSELKKSAERNSFDQIEEYVDACRSLSCIVGAGTIGHRIDSLLEKNQKDAAHWIFRIYSSYFLDVDPWVAPFRAVALGQPGNASISDLNIANFAMHQSTDALQRSEQAEIRLAEFIDEKTKIITSLEELYRKKLPVEEPAITWQTIANDKRSAWRFWLASFGALVMLPIFLVILNWRSLFDALASLSNGVTGFSIAGLAAVSVPALFYAWLLKNVSRIFIQNLMLADDAAHRKALAVTYLGLVENEKVQILETERALILNALFRPIPPNSADEGPPAGLLELLRK